MAADALSGVMVYAVQLAAIVGAGAMAARFVHLPVATLRIALWRSVVAMGVLLPLAGALGPHTPAALRFTMVETVHGVIATTTRSLFDGSSRLSAAALIVLVAGVLMRAGWLASGWRRLVKIGREAEPVSLDAALDELHQELAPQARIACHPAIEQPATFGMRRPLVLVPPDFPAWESARQRAVIGHELVHVRRRDWAWTVAEEAVRTVFWFHPAMRWAIAQLQASREEAVDVETVSRTGDRAAYVAALLSFTDAAEPAPAMPFIACHHLSVRIHRLLEEVHMSRVRRTAVAGVIVVCVLAVGLGVAVVAPLAAQAMRLKVGQNGVKPPTKIFDVRPEYPQELKDASIEGTVILQVVIGTDGSVVETSLVRSLHPAADASATEAVEQWRFTTTLLNGDPVEVEMYVTVNFTQK